MSTGIQQRNFYKFFPQMESNALGIVAHLNALGCAFIYHVIPYLSIKHHKK